MSSQAERATAQDDALARMDEVAHNPARDSPRAMNHHAWQASNNKTFPNCLLPSVQTCNTLQHVK
jgi:hypothetical protein